MTSHPSVHSATGAPRLLLRLEGALALAVALAAYAKLGGSFGTFAALFLVPDLAMLGYLVGPRTGAAAYNATHSTLGPGALAALALSVGDTTWLPVAAIWFAHIGFDRMLGYGLKYGHAFGVTHLGVLGRPRVGLATEPTPRAVSAA